MSLFTEYHTIRELISNHVDCRESRERHDSAGDDWTDGREAKGQAACEERTGRVLGVWSRIIVSQLTVHQLTHVTTNLRQAGVSTTGTTNTWHDWYVP